MTDRWDERARLASAECGAVGCAPSLCFSCLSVELRAAFAAGVEEERARCLDIVKTQAFAPDTKVGERQQWVKDRIADRIEDGV